MFSLRFTAQQCWQTLRADKEDKKQFLRRIPHQGIFGGL